MSKDKIILAENCVYSTDCKMTGLNNNVLVVGSTGCGKTMSVSEPRFLETYNSSLIATITKRCLSEKYRPMFEERGYKVYDLNFAEPKASDIGYDPLAYVKSYRDITFLAESIVKSDPAKEKYTGDPYWDNAGVSLLSAEIAYILMTKSNPTFGDVIRMHKSLEFDEKAGRQIKTSFDNRFERLKLQDSGCFAVTCFKTFKNLPIETASGVFSNLNSTLDTMFSPEICDIIDMEEKIDLKKLASEKTMLFLTTSPVNPTLNCFVNIFYSHIFKQLFEYAEEQPDGMLPVPVNVLCDDFATGSKINNFPEYISVFRAKGMSVTLMIQSESQLESMYGKGDATTIINNCDTYCYMGGMDIESAKNISTRLNVPVEDVLYMPLGDVVVFRRGQRPVTTRRYNILKNEKYRHVTEQYEYEIEKKK